MGKAKAAAKPAGTKKRRGVKLEPTELTASEIVVAEPSPELAALAKQVESDGGAVLASYREPLGGHALLFAALPVEKVEPTPFQRDVSDAHVRRLTRRDGQDQALPRPDHRGARRRETAAT